MTYIKTTWVNGSAPPINATNLNNIENGIFDITNDFTTHSTLTATLTTLGHVQNGLYTATIATTSWTTASAPYTSSITVTGILATDTPIIDVVMTGTFVDDEGIIEAWGGVYRAQTNANVVIFSATELPTVNLPIQLKVVR
jgi:hypothetical protein